MIKVLNFLCLILEFIKKMLFKTILGTIIMGAFLGVVVGICVACIVYGLCDLYQLPYATSLLTNANFETIAMLYIGGWGIAGIVAKVLPW